MKDRWKIAAVGGWSLAGVVLLLGASDRGEARLRRLVIEDERGRDAIVLDTLDGRAALFMLKPGSKEPALRISVGEDSPSIGVYNQSTGKPGLLLHPDGVVIYSEKRLKEARVSITVDDEDTPNLRLTAPGKRTTVDLPGHP